MSAFFLPGQMQQRAPGPTGDMMQQGPRRIFGQRAYANPNYQYNVNDKAAMSLFNNPAPILGNQAQGNPYMMNANGQITSAGVMGTTQQQQMGFKMITPSLVKKVPQPLPPGGSLPPGGAPQMGGLPTNLHYTPEQQKSY